MAHNCNRFSPPAWSMFTQRARLNRKKKSREGDGRSDQSQFRDCGLSRAPWVLLRANVDDTPHHAETHSSPCSDFRRRSRDRRAPGVSDPRNSNYKEQTSGRVLARGEDAEIIRRWGQFRNVTKAESPVVARSWEKKKGKDSDAKCPKEAAASERGSRGVDAVAIGVQRRGAKTRSCDGAARACATHGRQSAANWESRWRTERMTPGSQPASRWRRRWIHHATSSRP